MMERYDDDAPSRGYAGWTSTGMLSKRNGLTKKER